MRFRDFEKLTENQWQQRPNPQAQQPNVQVQGQPQQGGQQAQQRPNPQAQQPNVQVQGQPQQGGQQAQQGQPVSQQPQQGQRDQVIQNLHRQIMDMQKALQQLQQTG